MGRRGNFKTVVRRVDGLTIVILNHETIHVFTKNSGWHTTFHRWFAIKRTYQAWCEFCRFLVEEEHLTIGAISEAADELDIPHINSSRPVEKDGTVYNYDTEETKW